MVKGRAVVAVSPAELACCINLQDRYQWDELYLKGALWAWLPEKWAGIPRDASEGNGPRRRPQKRLERRLEKVVKAVLGGYTVSYKCH